MSELKEHQFCECAEIVREYRGPFSNEVRPYYLKSEADKVIALLTDKANYNEYAYKLKSEELADTCRFYEDEIRHHKYKRCLAMAKWCMTEYIHSKCLDFTNTEQWYWRRWHIRWLELAEKFKEAK